MFIFFKFNNSNYFKNTNFNNQNSYQLNEVITCNNIYIKFEINIPKIKFMYLITFQEKLSRTIQLFKHK